MLHNGKACTSDSHYPKSDGNQCICGFFAQVEQKHYTNDVKGYRDAVWDFLLEHCEITDTGSYFFKFHGSGRKNFEKRIHARFKYSYHREDVLSKNDHAVAIKTEHENEKNRKRREYKEAKKKRRRLSPFLKFVDTLKTLYNN